jgi:hypothetical protein
MRTELAREDALLVWWAMEGRPPSFSMAPRLPHAISLIAGTDPRPDQVSDTSAEMVDEALAGLAAT